MFSHPASQTDGATPGEHVFDRAARYAAEFRAGLPERPVMARMGLDELADAFGGALPSAGAAPHEVLDALVEAAEPGLMATAGPRYFGFVIGGALEAATAADIVAAGWDQCAFNTALSPAAIAAEAAAGTWLKDLLGIPDSASVGFVTGGQEANTVGLAAARHHVLSEAGWDVEQGGLPGAPTVRILAPEERHATIDRAVRLLGFGTDTIHSVRADGNGATDVGDLERLLQDTASGPTVVCLQAGNVNTGACDDLQAGCDIAHDHGAWVHVDGAFGLWAAANPTTRHLVDGVAAADSWACDGHKWLNVPYDAGYVFCSRPSVHAAAVSYTAAYLTGSGTGPAVGADLTLGSSRRARGFATWAALRQLGRDGVAEVIERCCTLAHRFAAGLSAGGLQVVNDVVINQVLVAVGGDAETERVLSRVQSQGVCWLGGTTWRGRRLLRISVANASTTEQDVDRCVAAILSATGP